VSYLGKVGKSFLSRVVRISRSCTICLFRTFSVFGSSAFMSMKDIVGRRRTILEFLNSVRNSRSRYLFVDRHQTGVPGILIHSILLLPK